MALPVLTCPKFLALLEEFYRDLPDAPRIDALLVPAEELPQPQRRLLVHRSDMTSTLGLHYGEPIALRVLDRKLAGLWYSRHIVLQTAHSQRPAEYGAIRIFLPLLDEASRADVLQGQLPVGAILVDRGLAFRSCPGAYFKIFSNPLINDALRLETPQWLYGRCNCLTDKQGRMLADVVEILPPDSGRAAALPEPAKHAT